MKFIKREDISENQRFLLGAQMLQERPYGYVTAKAEELNVSRFFLYSCLWMVKQLLGIAEVLPLARTSNIKWVIVTLYLNCEASIEGIRKSVSLLHNQNVSVGFISEVLNAVGAKLPTSEKNISMILRFTSDEIFINRRPILISVDPHSGYILDLTVCEMRDADTWGYCWLEMLDNQTGNITRIVADLGTGMQGAINELFHKAIFQSDLFHYYRKLFPVLSHLESGCVKTDKNIEQLKKDIAKCKKRLQKARSKELEKLEKKLKTLQNRLYYTKARTDLEKELLIKKDEALQNEIADCEQEIAICLSQLQTARDKSLNILKEELKNLQQQLANTQMRATKTLTKQEELSVTEEIDVLKKEILKCEKKIQHSNNNNIGHLKGVLKELQRKLEIAKKQEIKALMNYEALLDAYPEMRECFSFIDANGNLKSYSESLAHLEYIIEYLQCVDNTKVKEVASFMKRHKESVLNYFNDIEILRTKLETLIEDEFIRSIFCLIGDYEHRLGSLQGKEKKFIKKEISDWKSMLQEELGKTKFEEYYGKSSKDFGQILRSSSMVENVNSRLRRFADSARGQLTQNRLNLIRFHLNHKPFERSEKRKGLSPYQMFFNKEAGDTEEFKLLEEIIAKRA